MNRQEIAGELQELGNAVSCYAEGLVKETRLHDYDRISSSWIHHFGMVSPKEVYTILEKGCNGLHIAFSEEPGYTIISMLFGNDRVQAELRMYPEEYEANKTLSDTSALYLEDFNATPNQTGIAKKALRNLYDFRSRLYPHIKEFTAHPVLMGAYTWARFGFLPSAENWKSIKPNTEDAQGGLRYTLKKRARAIARQLSPTERAALRDIIMCDSPEAIWDIADMAKEITVPRSEEIREPFEEFIPQSGRMPLGKYLLAGQWWRGGALQFNNERAMTRFNSYLAKLGIEERDVPSKGIDSRSL